VGIAVFEQEIRRSWMWHQTDGSGSLNWYCCWLIERFVLEGDEATIS
jgi:hypothetical protein